jgi:type IV pilus assembly protein PilF
VKRVLAMVALAALSACARQQEGPTTTESGPGATEVTEPRNRARLHTELASAYYERGNMSVALDELRVAQQADPRYAPIYSMFGLVYMELRENELAQTNFERAIAIAPTDPDINHNYGLFLCQTKREAESVKYFMQALKNPLHTTPWRSYASAGVCSMRIGNVKDAETYFERALKLDPDEPGALLQLGQIRYKQARFEESRRLVSRYNKLVTPNAESLWLGLRVERKLGERVAEQSYANQLRRRFPGSAEYQAMQRGQFD